MSSVELMHLKTSTILSGNIDTLETILAKHKFKITIEDARILLARGNNILTALYEKNRVDDDVYIYTMLETNTKKIDDLLRKYDTNSRFKLCLILFHEAIERADGMVADYVYCYNL